MRGGKRRAVWYTTWLQVGLHVAPGLSNSGLACQEREEATPLASVINPAGASVGTGQPSRFVPAWPAGLDERRARLEALIRGLGRALVAYSGGVDSALVLKVCRDVLGQGATCWACSPSRRATPQPRAGSRRCAWRARIDADGARDPAPQELANPDYAAQPGQPLLLLQADAVRRPGAAAEAERLRDHCRRLQRRRRGRPPAGPPGGARAGRAQPAARSRAEQGRHPRAVAGGWACRPGTSPSLACLSSRIPYGTPVTAAALAQIDAAENVLRDLGFAQVRVRHYGEQKLAKIEVEPALLPRLVAAGHPRAGGGAAEGARLPPCDDRPGRLPHAAA